MKRSQSTEIMLSEIIQFIRLYETEMNYRMSDFNDFYNIASQKNYKHIGFKGGEIFLDQNAEPLVRDVFLQFLAGMGTTDVNGQCRLCTEYISCFSEMLSARRLREKNRLRVNFAVGMLCAVGVVVAFI